MSRYNTPKLLKIETKRKAQVKYHNTVTSAVTKRADIAGKQKATKASKRYPIVTCIWEHFCDRKFYLLVVSPESSTKRKIKLMS